MTVVREDQMMISLVCGPNRWWPFDKMTGGECLKLQLATGRVIVTYNEMVLSLARMSDRSRIIPEICQWVGKEAHVIAEHLSNDAKPTGQGLVYYGEIVGAQAAPYDADSNRPAIDKAVFVPYSIDVLGEAF